jgi:gluconokinase
MSEYTRPRSPHDLTKGLIYFARMVEKIRLHAAGTLHPDYADYLGDHRDPTHFDGRCCRFLGLPYTTIRDRVLAGGSDEDILEWCYQNGIRRNDEEVLVWNSFIRKRGWRDGPSTDELERQKAAAGLGHRTDIETYFDFHEVDEGRRA